MYNFFSIFLLFSYLTRNIRFCLFVCLSSFFFIVFFFNGYFPQYKMKKGILSLFLSLSPLSNVVDDEEEMLYGDSNADATPSKDDLGRSFGQPTFSDGGSGKAEPSHWCMIIRENGVMEVRASTPSFDNHPSAPSCTSCFLPLFGADLPAARVAPGVPGEELPGRPESAGGQLVRPVCHPGGREEGGGDAAGGDPPRQGGGAGVARLQPQQAVPAGETFH